VLSLNFFIEAELLGGPKTLKKLAAGAGRNLILIGYRATGKTSAGAQLGRLLDRPFVDLDEILVQEAGRSIAQIVAESGWEEFRRREKELVARFRHARGIVLATGGGVVLDPENVQALRENGIIIWLTADPATIQARLAGDRPKAPSRPSLTAADPIAEVLEVLKVREPLYRAAAQIVIDTAGRSLGQVVEKILAALEQEEPHHGG
jgi:shikimate kinase